MKAKRVLAAVLCAAMIFSTDGFTMGVSAASNTLNTEESDIELIGESPVSSQAPEDDEQEENENESPAATESPDSSEEPTAVQSPESTETPEETAVPSQTPVEEETPESSMTPSASPAQSEEPSISPVPSAIPEETIDPEQSAEPSALPEESGYPTPSATPEDGQAFLTDGIELVGVSLCFEVDEDGVLRLKEGATLTSSLEIPKEAKKIPADAKLFKGNRTISKITFEEGSMLTEIEAGAFEGSSLQSIVIPEGVEEIKEATFKSSLLNEITFQGTSSVEAVGKEAFMNTKLVSFKAPLSLKTIGESAFSGCNSLLNFNMNSIEKIGVRAFFGCSGLDDVGITWSKNLYEIGDYAFSGCGFTELKMASVNANNAGEMVIGMEAFGDCNKLAEVEALPANLKTISKQMFYNCKSLKQITLPDSLETIEEGAFRGCKVLGTIEIGENIKKIGRDAFFGCEAIKTITIKRKDVDADDFLIEEDAFPLKSDVTMYGYGGKVEDYAETRGYTYKTLSTKYTLAVSGDFSSHASMKATNVTLEDKKLWALPGEEIKIIIEPKEGWVLKEETLKPAELKMELVSYTDTTQTFSFVMPEKNVTIDADFFEADKLSKVQKLTWKATKVNEVSVIQDTEKDKITIENAGQQTKLVVTASGDGMPNTSNPWLFKFTSSNKDVATISETGIITAKGKGTTTIKAAFRKDESKYRKITVTVGEDVFISDLTLDFTNLGRARKETEVIDGTTYTVIKYNKATLASSDRTFKVTLTATSEEEPDTNLMVTSSWKSANTEIATVSGSSSISNSNTITVKKGTEGETMITVSVKNNDEDKTVCEENFIVRVIDATPRLADAKITVNKASDIGTAVKIVPVYKYEIATGKELTVCQKVTKNKITTYEPYEGLQVTYADGVYRIKATSSLNLKSGEQKVYSESSQLYIEGEFEEGGTFRIPIPKLVLTAKQLNPTVKLSGKINLFYSANATDQEKGSVTLTQSIKDETVRKYELVSEANYKKKGSETVDSFDANFNIEQVNNETFKITRSSGDMVKDEKGKNVTSGYIYLYYEGYDDSEVVKKKISISTCDTAPSYVLKTTSATASKYKENQEFELQLVDKKTKKQVLDLSGLADDGLTFDSSSKGTTPELFKDQLTTNTEKNAIVLQVNGTPFNGKAVINVQLEAWSRPLKYTFSLKATNTLPKGILSAQSVTLNQNCRSQEAVLKVTVDQRDAAIAGFVEGSLIYTGNKKYAADAAKLMDEMTVDSDGTIHISLPADTIKDTTYGFKIAPAVRFEESDEPIALKEIAFKVVVNSKLPTIKLKSSSFSLNAAYPGAETIQTTYTLSNIPADSDCSVDTSMVVLTAVNEKSQDAKNLIGKLNVAFDENGKVSVSLKEGSKIFKNFSYDYYVNDLVVMIGSDPVKLDRFKIKVKGSVDKKPAVSVSAKGTINSLDRNSAITFTAKVSNISCAIEDVDIWEFDTTNGKNNYFLDEDGNKTSAHFIARQIDGKTVVTVKDEDDVILKAGTSYKVQLVYKLTGIADKQYVTKEITIKPKQTLPKIKTDKTSAYIYAGQSLGTRKVDIAITKTDLKDVEIEDVVFADGTSDLVKKAYRVTYDPATGKATLTLVNPALITIGSKQTIKMEVKYKYQMEKSTGSIIKMDVTVRK